MTNIQLLKVVMQLKMIADDLKDRGSEEYDSFEQCIKSTQNNVNYELNKLYLKDKA